MVPGVFRPKKGPYLPQPELSDVLFEQFEFLMLHLAHGAANCADCARAQRLVKVLMSPFE